MTEVSRLNTLSADHAKEDFISNVSHELRSPLHGILASVEFLSETMMDGFQRNLVETVDICGRTLLDTIEHVLDFVSYHPPGVMLLFLVFAPHSSKSTCFSFAYPTMLWKTHR